MFIISYRGFDLSLELNLITFSRELISIRNWTIHNKPKAKNLDAEMVYFTALGSILSLWLLNVWVYDYLYIKQYFTLWVSIKAHNNHVRFRIDDKLWFFLQWYSFRTFNLNGHLYSRLIVLKPCGQDQNK